MPNENDSAASTPNTTNTSAAGAAPAAAATRAATSGTTGSTETTRTTSTTRATVPDAPAAVFDAERLRDWTRRVFRAAGSSDDEARLTADHLVEASLAGHDSHGVGMVPRYIESLEAGQLQLNRHARIVVDHGAVLTIDADRGMGQSVTHEAMQIAIERAGRFGVCAMGLRNAHHLGRVGHWAEQAIAAGMVSIHFTNAMSRPVVAPHGGAEPRFVTNPFTVGIPRHGRDPVVLDFATSALASGKVRVAYNRGEPVPAGTLIDHEGRPTTNASTHFVDPIGALLTFGGHKGHALAIVCELLGAALTGGETTRPEHRPGSTPAVWNNMLTIVLDPARFGDPERFDAEAAGFEDWVRSARTMHGVDRIRMPGEPERDTRAARLASGIAIDATTLAQLDAAAATASRRGAAATAADGARTAAATADSAGTATTTTATAAASDAAPMAVGPLSALAGEHAGR